MWGCAARCSGGLLGALAPTDDLGDRCHRLAWLYFGAHCVSTQVRPTEAA